MSVTQVLVPPVMVMDVPLALLGCLDLRGGVWRTGTLALALA